MHTRYMPLATPFDRNANLVGSDSTLRDVLFPLFIGILLAMALVLGTMGASMAVDLHWTTGNGPLATGLGDGEVTALAVGASGTTLYAGTGSGTVFQAALPATPVPGATRQLPFLEPLLLD